MAGMITAVCRVLFAAAQMAAIAPPTKAAMTCGQVTSNLAPCLPYLTNKGPLGDCCNGVKKLYDAAQTTKDRQSICCCLKSLAGSYLNATIGKAAGLPSQCGVNFPYEISPSTDFSKVQ